MSHNEKRTNWAKEGVLGFATGVLFGVTSVCVGHPFDTIKTKMQAQQGFENMNMRKSFAFVFKKEGIKGLYRGCIPPLLGSGFYRSIQFSAFEATYTFLDNPVGKKAIPMTNGLEVRVILGGTMAGTCRALIETPLEYAKIRRQTGTEWKLKDSFKGLGVTWFRSLVLLPSYFVFLDTFRRRFDKFDALNDSQIIKPFLTSACASVMAWWIVWPLEVIKSQIQANYKAEKNSIQQIMFVIKERGGLFGLYRGITPGSIRSFFANGSAFVVMSLAQRKVTEMGFRD